MLKVSHNQNTIKKKHTTKGFEGAKIHHCPVAVSSALKPSGLSKILRFQYHQF